MTYYEWVNNLKNLKTSPMDYELLNKLNNSKLDGGIYVYYRLAKHVNLTINNRLTTVYKTVIHNLSDVNKSIDDLSLDLIHYRNELKFINKIIQLPVIPEDSRELIKVEFNKSLDEIYDYLRKIIGYIDVDGEHFSMFDKIMNGVEE